MCSKILIMGHRCVVDVYCLSSKRDAILITLGVAVTVRSCFPTQFEGDLQGLSEISKFSKPKLGNGDCDPETYPKHLRGC